MGTLLISNRYFVEGHGRFAEYGIAPFMSKVRGKTSNTDLRLARTSAGIFQLKINTDNQKNFMGSGVDSKTLKRRLTSYHRVSTTIREGSWGFGLGRGGKKPLRMEEGDACCSSLNQSAIRIAGPNRGSFKKG